MEDGVHDADKLVVEAVVGKEVDAGSVGRAHPCA